LNSSRSVGEFIPKKTDFRKNKIKNLILILLLTVTSACSVHEFSSDASSQSDESLNRQIPSNDGPIQLVTTPNANGHPEFTELFASAKTNINLAMFRLTEPSDIQALIDAAKRNVKVRVIVDGDTAKSWPKYVGVQKQLTDAGAEIKLSSKGFSITHEKSATIDNETALISSINLTMAYKVTRDFGVITKDADVIKEFNAVFEADWVNADTGKTTTPALNSGKLVWSPTNSSAKIISLIGQAKASLELYVENFTDQNISDALIAAAKGGATVRVITPLCSDNPSNPLLNLPQMQDLVGHNVSVKVMPPPKTEQTPYIHAKAIVVDDSFFYVGSMNFSYNSLTKAREVGIILQDKNTAQNIESVFDQDWSHAIDLPTGDTSALCHGPQNGKAVSGGQ